jgi:dolichol-phosphate mannosyltransferase
MSEDPWVSIILATYNEKENILDLIHGLLEHIQSPLEIIVVDDDSPDETWRIATTINDPRIKVIRRIATRGLASAINRGIIESQGTIVCWMDTDMCMPPSMLPEMIKKLDEFDIVIGSRYTAGGGDDRARIRVWSSWLINRFASLILGYGIKDYDSGFIALRRNVFNSVSIIPTGYGAYFIEFLFTCRRKGLTVFEMPYKFKDRAKGVSKSFPNLLTFASTGLGYIFRILNARIRKIE